MSVHDRRGVGAAPSVPRLDFDRAELPLRSYADSLSGRTSRPQHGHRERAEHRDRKQPPRRDAERLTTAVAPIPTQTSDEHQRVVADDEVDQERAERPSASHAGDRRPGGRRTTRHERQRRREVERDERGDRRVARRPVAPAPSAAQNVPNDVSITPTAYFSVFSGTRLSGARASTPATTTTTIATTAAITASGTLSWLLPNVTTMNATSSPSSSTPLKLTVNA